jgi:predicted ferric reductase
VFYFTHWLHIVFYILLILHATHFWKWFIFPLVCYIFERLYTFVRIRSQRFGDTYIKDVHLLSSRVTQLIITRPPNFKFKSGDYVYVRIPHIARYEWHPFTISSAPELKDELWLHIRSLGNWTNKLYEHFRETDEVGRRASVLGADAMTATRHERKMSNLVVMIDYRKSTHEMDPGATATSKAESKKNSVVDLVYEIS